MTTPIADRLRQYGEVRGLTHGAYAEASPDVHHLTSALADSIARRVWRSWGAASVTEARAFVITRLRRIIGVTGARAMARHFLRRLPFVGLSRADMDRRRRDMRRARDRAALGPHGRRRPARGGLPPCPTRPWRVSVQGGVTATRRGLGSDDADL